MYWHDMDGWSWAWMTSMMVLFWIAAIAVIVAIVVVIRSVSRPHDSRPTARDILDERLARGEMTIEDYVERCASLRDRGSGSRP